MRTLETLSAHCCCCVGYSQQPLSPHDGGRGCWRHLTARGVQAASAQRVRLLPRARPACTAGGAPAALLPLPGAPWPATPLASSAVLCQGSHSASD